MYYEIGHFFSELRLQPKTTTVDPHVYTTTKPRRKQQPGYNKGLNEVVRAKETHYLNQMHQENTLFVGGIGVSQRAKSEISDGNVESGNVNIMIKEAEGKIQFKTRKDSIGRISRLYDTRYSYFPPKP